jgi:hypothetical protein
MKHLAALTILLLTISINLSFAQTNDFYDDAETHDLPMSSITLTGELANPGVIDMSSLPLRSVVVKETLLDGSGEKFVGAYRYDGYSLYDILNLAVVQKKTQATFPPIIDLYVELENDKGEKVVLSWGEIYYPIHRHEILIASRVARIVPSKTKEQWTLPVQSKLVVASDLLTERNISNPVKITVKSYQGEFNIQKGMKPMYSESLTFYNHGKEVSHLTELPGSAVLTYPAVFYGRGTGIHGTTPFSGVLLNKIILPHYPLTAINLQKGLFAITGKDGYHAVYTYSEIMNRNDQAEVLLFTTEKNEDTGFFKLYPAADFFSDRAIKSVESIDFRNQ